MACELKGKTNNPICSDSIKDLKDNAIIMDQYINSAEFVVSDRLGVPRKTWAGIEKDAQDAIDGFEQFIDDKIIAQGGVEIINDRGHASDENVFSAEYINEENDVIHNNIEKTKLQDRYVETTLQDLVVARNRIGATLAGTSVFSHVFSDASLERADKLIEALAAIPGSKVFTSIITFGNTAVTLRVRDIEDRFYTGSARNTYSKQEFNDIEYHKIEVRGDWLSTIRTTYHFDNPKKLSEQEADIGARYIRFMINAMPKPGSSPLPSTVSNGVLYKREGETGSYYTTTCYIDSDMNLKVIPHKGKSASSISESLYYKNGAVQTLSFRIPLIVDGAIFDAVGNGYTTKEGYESVKSGRTAIGQKSNGNLIVVVADGKTNISGLSIKELSELMLSLGCVEAMNLDGGGSSEMIVGGNIVNSPSDGSERNLINGLYLI